jgi:hypothetical protein
MVIKVKVPYFDNAEIELDNHYLPDDPNDPTLLEFLKLDKSDRLKDSRHVFTYYRDFHTMVGGEDWLDEEMGVVSDPEQIWAHVDPISIALEDGEGTDGNRYIMIEADANWEPEHALMMVWENGKTLCKVGEYDGHVTNAGADADEDLTNVVYDGERGFKTYRD